MTVERHEFRKRKTITTVRMAPSIKVAFTLATDTRIGRELSPMACKDIPGGKSLLLAVSSADKRSTTWTVFSSCDF